MRINQWIKNFFVAIPFILSLKFLQFNFLNYLHLLIGVIAFCLISSAVYILNDINDLEEDRNHPKKKNRPITNGSVSIKFATILCITLTIISSSLTYQFFNNTALLILFLYLIKNIIYTFKAKHFAIFDTIFISLGFVLRILFGIFAFETPISKWIILLTFTLCLFLAFTKRRQDFITDGYLRHSLKGYNITMLDQFISISSALAISSYVMYSVEMFNTSNNYGFILSNIFVFFGIFRYLQAVHLDNFETGESGMIIYKDTIFLINLFLWIVTLLLCLIFNKIS